jgi:hypothetical protein
MPEPHLWEGLRAVSEDAREVQAQVRAAVAEVGAQVGALAQLAEKTPAESPYRVDG